MAAAVRTALLVCLTQLLCVARGCGCGARAGSEGEAESRRQENTADWAAAASLPPPPPPVRVTDSAGGQTWQHEW